MTILDPVLEQPRWVYTCPVDDCPWEYDRATVQRRAPTQGAPRTYTSAREAIAAWARAINAVDDAVAREHLESHDVIDFVRTIARLRDQLAAHEAGA